MNKHSTIGSKLTAQKQKQNKTKQKKEKKSNRDLNEMYDGKKDRHSVIQLTTITITNQSEAS